MRGLRELAAPFVAAAPAGARVRARLRVSPADEAVLRAAGRIWGRWPDGTWPPGARRGGWTRGAGPCPGRAEAGADGGVVVAVGRRDHPDQRGPGPAGGAEPARRGGTLQARVRADPGPAGGPGRREGRRGARVCHPRRAARQGRPAPGAEGRLARVERQLEAGAVSVVRGGKALLRKRGNLAAAGLTEARWRPQWESARLFLTADGEKDKAWGNETIRWHPGQGWLEVKLPAPLAYLANRPHGRYRLSCPVEFSYRGDEVAAQAASARSAMTSARPGTGAGTSTRRGKPPRRRASLQELRRHRVVAVDVNAGHLAVAVLTPDGNVIGTPATIGLDLAGLPARCARRAAAGRHQRPDRHSRTTWRAGDRDRGPGLRRSPVRRTRRTRQPAVARQAGTPVPAGGRWHPHRPVPRPPGPDGRQRRPARHRR